VKVHLRNIFDKIQVNSRTEAAMYAVQQGLIGDKSVNSDNSIPYPQQKPQLPSGPLFDNPQTGEENPSLPAGKKNLRRMVWAGITSFLVLLAVLIFIQNTSQNNTNLEGTGFDSTRWEKLPDLVEGREGLGLVLHSNQLFAIGGTMDSGVTGQVNAYPFDTGKWEPKKPKPTPVGEIQAVTVAGLIYIPGGIGSDGAVTDILEIYNPSQDSWMKGTPLPEPRCRYALVALEGMIYLFGGWDGQSYQNDVYAYDPVENQWETLTPMVAPRAWTGGAVSGGRIYLFGGINDNGISDQVDVFSPPNPIEPSGVWSQENPMPEKRYGFGSTSLAELIFIVGGQGEGDTGVTDWVFYPEIDEWRSFPSPIKPGVIGQGVTGAGTHLYIAGGRVENEIQNLVYAYQAFFTASLPIVR
jgi:hypothetical protein